MTVIVKKIGGSVGILIPKQLATEMNLKDGTPLSVSATSDQIVIRKQGKRARRSMRQIVSKLKLSSYRRRAEPGDDKPVGKEIW